MTLNVKQEMFCKEYLIDLNATQAAIRAGYSAKTAYSQGQRLLKHVEVATRVKALKASRADELELDAYWVLKRLKDISDRSMKAMPVMEFSHDKQRLVPTGEYQFDSSGANKATELIGKHVGMFDPRMDLHKKMLQAQIAKVEKEVELMSKDPLRTEPLTIQIVDSWVKP